MSERNLLLSIQRIIQISLTGGSIMMMVEMLQHFLRAQRESNWDLHMWAFKQMIPYFHLYNHTNYAHWRLIYVHLMHALPTEVKGEFHKGNWTVK